MQGKRFYILEEVNPFIFGKHRTGFKLTNILLSN